MLRLAVIALSIALAFASPRLAPAGPAQPVFHLEVQDFLAQLQQHLEMGRGPMGGPPMGGMDGPLGPGMRGPRGHWGPGGMMGPGMMGPGMPGMPGMMTGASPAERPLITIMLHHRTELALTPEQVTQLEGLRDGFARDAIRRDADIRIGELDLQGLLAAEPMDLAKAEAKIREVAQLRADLRVARLKTIEQGKAVLTPDQKARLQSVMAGGPARHSARGGIRL